MHAIDRSGPPPNSVLGRGVSLLFCFDGDARRDLSLAELTSLSKLPKATVHRLMSELTALGMTERTGRGYRLGIQLFELGLRADRTLNVQDVAMPAIQELFEATRKTVHFAILDGVDVVVLGKFKGPDTPRLPTYVGARVPAYCTAVGKVLVAHADKNLWRAVLEQPRERRTRHTITAPGLLARQFESILDARVAYDHEETALGAVCVAAPIFDRDRKAVAAVSLAGRSTTFDEVKMTAAVRAAAARMSRLMSTQASCPPLCQV